MRDSILGLFNLVRSVISDPSAPTTITRGKILCVENFCFEISFSSRDFLNHYGLFRTFLFRNCWRSADQQRPNKNYEYCKSEDVFPIYCGILRCLLFLEPFIIKKLPKLAIVYQKLGIPRLSSPDVENMLDISLVP